MNGYIADENLCSSAETKEAFQAPEIRQSQISASYFYSFLKWAFTDSS